MLRLLSKAKVRIAAERNDPVFEDLENAKELCDHFRVLRR